MSTEATFKTCLESLERVQQFDATSLSRQNDLGSQLSFAEAVKPAEAIIAVYKRIPVSSLSDFSDTQLNAILTQANSDFNSFKQILDFSATAADANATRTNILAAIKLRRDQLFDHVWQYVAYGVARVTDTSVFETQARSTLQSIEDKAGALTSQLGKAKEDADLALGAIRAVALEQGVSQQSSYFKSVATEQEELAAKWLTYTYGFAIAVGVFAVLSLGLHKIPWLKPDGTIEAIQMISSKVLIFTVLGYMLVMAARNYTTHKHNSVVNQHRQNALLTYRAVVEAAGEKGTEDIVLAYAAACNF